MSQSQAGGQMVEVEKNPLLENVDRTVFTFNMHNLQEMCFDHVFKRKVIQNQQQSQSQGSKAQLEPKYAQQVDECIVKYMQALKVVQAATQEELIASRNIQIQRPQSD